MDVAISESGSVLHSPHPSGFTLAGDGTVPNGSGPGASQGAPCPRSSKGEVRMALYLPRNLAPLATVAATENPRYAVTGVRVLDPGDGTYRLKATDGKRLAIVRG